MDMNGLDSLLSQITSELVQERHVQTTKRKAGTVEGKFGFSDLIRKVLKVDVNLGGEIETQQVVNKTTTQPYEAKIQQIIGYLEDEEILLKNRSEIITKYKENKQNLVFLTMPFNTDFNYNNWLEATRLANKVGYISFYKGCHDTDRYHDNYEYNDSYYKTMALDRIKVTMNLGIEKMEPLGGITSHLAVLFRETRGTNIHLGVFGHIFKLTNTVFQIKPYAVWRT